MVETKTVQVGAFALAWQVGSARWTLSCGERVVARGDVGPFARHDDVDVAAELRELGAIQAPALPDVMSNGESPFSGPLQEEETQPEILPKRPAKKARRKRDV